MKEQPIAPENDNLVVETSTFVCVSCYRRRLSLSTNYHNVFYNFLNYFCYIIREKIVFIQILSIIMLITFSEAEYPKLKCGVNDISDEAAGHALGKIPK